MMVVDLRHTPALVLRYLQRLSHSAGELFFPPICMLCGSSHPGTEREESWLCVSCRSLVAGLERALPIMPNCSREHTDPSFGSSPPFLRGVAATAFRSPIDEIVHRFKYPPPGLSGLDPVPRRLLTHLLLETTKRVGLAPPEAVIPIPLHPRRLRKRGFNPAALLARALAREYGRPCLPEALERTRNTPSQTGLDKRARAANVRGAFQWRGAPPSPRSVWLVDDVVTTGATLESAARALGKAGIREITAICVARTPLDPSRD